MAELSDPVVIEQRFSASQEEVWKAITERDQMVQWFFDNIPDFKPEAGFETQFIIDTSEREFDHRWKILEAIPNEKIVYDWRYEGFPGVGKVTFEILSQDEGSLIRVTSVGMETFPQDVPEFSRESCVGGWQYFIQGTLKGLPRILDRNPRCPSVQDGRPYVSLSPD